MYAEAAFGAKFPPTHHNLATLIPITHCNQVQLVTLFLLQFQDYLEKDERATQIWKKTSLVLDTCQSFFKLKQIARFLCSKRYVL